ncbi:MAG: C-terminal binding protein [Chloroflexota bacterium]
MGTPLPRTVTIVDSGEMMKPGIERLRAAGIEVTVVPDGAAPIDAARAAADASAVIDGTLAMREAEIAEMKAAKLIVRAGIGYDLIDVESATKRGIWVANVPDYCADEVADHALMLLLACWRRLDQHANTWRQNRKWIIYEQLAPVYRPSSKTLGIVGMGRIGWRVAQRAAPFGWRILGHDPVLPDEEVRRRGAEPVSMDELFAQSDAVSLHLPLMPSTHHLLDARRLALMPAGAVVVNTSRGGLIDIGALDDAVVSGHIAAAGLDVLEDEPRPDMDQPIFSRSNVIVTSHTAWYSVDSRRELAILCAEEAIRVIEGGRPRNAVNPEVE